MAEGTIRNNTYHCKPRYFLPNSGFLRLHGPPLRSRQRTYEHRPYGTTLLLHGDHPDSKPNKHIRDGQGRDGGGWRIGSDQLGVPNSIRCPDNIAQRIFFCVRTIFVTDLLVGFSRVHQTLVCVPARVIQSRSCDIVLIRFASCLLRHLHP